MKLPRDLDGEDLATTLVSLGFERSPQTGSHIQMRHVESGEVVTVPAHTPLKVGTLSAILRDVAQILGIDRAEMLAKL